MRYKVKIIISNLFSISFPLCGHVKKENVLLVIQPITMVIERLEHDNMKDK
jgi:hypothetical protein